MVGCANSRPNGSKNGPVVPREPLTADHKSALIEAERLFREQDPRLEPARVALLQDPHTTAWWTRAMIGYARGSKDRYLIKLRQDVDSVAKPEAVGFEQALAELRKIGALAVPIIANELLRDRRKPNRDLGVDLLAGMGPEVLPALAPTLTASEASLRNTAIRAVAAMPAGPAVQAALLRASKDPDYAVRGAAVAGLGRTAANLPLLLVAVGDADPFVQHKAIEALTPFRNRTSAEAVVAYYKKAVAQKDREGLRCSERVLWRMSGVARRRPVTEWEDWAASLPEAGD